MSDPEVQKAINNLPKTLEQLSEIQKTIDDNQELIDGLAKLMSKENVQKLNDLIDSIDSGDYAGKLQKYGVLAEDADDLIAKLQSMISTVHRMISTPRRLRAPSRTSCSSIRPRPSLRAAALRPPRPTPPSRFRGTKRYLRNKIQ